MKVQDNKLNVKPLINSKTVTLSQYFENLLIRDSREQIITKRYKDEIKYTQISADDDNDNDNNNINDDNENDGDDEIDAYTSYNSYMSSSEAGSDNLLVTFDYGYSDSLDSDISSWKAINKSDMNVSVEENSTQQKHIYQNSKRFMYIINEQASKKDSILSKTHKILQHFKHDYNFEGNYNHHYNEDDREESINFSILLPPLKDYKHETLSSGDYGSWQDDSYTQKLN